MLKNIHVKNFALIDEVEIDLSDGLNILTGETGAGKSIIIDAVNFALGQRVSKDVVRDDTEYALSELIFDIDTKDIENKLKELEIPSDDGEIILQRKINNGKTTARVNGETVTAAVLKDLASCLIDIHGQHDNQSLLNKSAHLQFLDSLLDDKTAGLLSKLKELYVNYTAKLRELSELTGKETEKELEYKKYQLNEIESASLKVGEDEELEQLYKKMSSSKRIAESVSMAHRITGYDTDGAGASVGRALYQIRQISDLDEGAKDLELILTDIDSLLNDFNRSIADYESTLEFSDEDFNEVEQRINILNSIKSRFGGTIEDALAFREQLLDEIEKLQNIDFYRENLKAETASLKAEILKLCSEISDIRKHGAVEISKHIEESLKELNFLDSKFEICVTADEENISILGYDEVEFLICTNPGEKLKPLVSVASGGEMSRIMLAIKSVMANRDNIPTLIFDEIDTGISGRTAQKVSEKMAMISKDHQVICVTHLPQIAAMADAHFEIKKEAIDGHTATDIRRLTGEEITSELARMLGGVSITEAVLENAKDMKTQADEIKNTQK